MASCQECASHQRPHPCCSMGVWSAACSLCPESHSRDLAFLGLHPQSGGDTVPCDRLQVEVTGDPLWWGRPRLVSPRIQWQVVPTQTA